MLPESVNTLFRRIYTTNLHELPAFKNIKSVPTQMLYLIGTSKLKIPNRSQMLQRRLKWVERADPFECHLTVGSTWRVVTRLSPNKLSPLDSIYPSHYRYRKFNKNEVLPLVIKNDVCNQSWCVSPHFQPTAEVMQHYNNTIWHKRKIGVGLLTRS